MKIILENNKNISLTTIPESISGNYWIVDYDSKNLLNIVENNDQCFLKSNADIKIIEKKIVNDTVEEYFIDSCLLEIGKNYYAVDINTMERYIIYVLPNYEHLENLIILEGNSRVLIGSGEETDIIVNNPLFSKIQLIMNFDRTNDTVTISNANNKYNLYVNNNLCLEKQLSVGDVIFINGVYIYYFKSILLVSNNNQNLSFNLNKFKKREIKISPQIDYTKIKDKEVVFLNEDDYFQRPPRFKRQIVKKTFNIDSPTPKETQEEMPLIFSIAPMLTMGMMSMVTGVTSLQKVLTNESTVKEQIPSLLMCAGTLIAMIIFPFAQKIYTRKQKEKKEIKRREMYKKYIDNKRTEIIRELDYQKSVILEDNLSMKNVRDVILNKSRTLWERKLTHNDFLQLRLGIGNKIPEIEIKYAEERFTIEEDDLKNLIVDLVNESREIEDVPITLNFITHNKVALVGKKEIINKFFDNLMLQVMAYHGYDMLRVVILTSSENKDYWDKFKSIPYLWNNEKSVRYFVSNKDDINKVTSLLMEEYNYRKEIVDTDNAKKQFKPYYLVLTDDVDCVKNNVFIGEILKSDINLGYSVIMSDEKINSIPNECNMFINVTEDNSGIFTNQITEDSQINFKADLVDFKIRDCITQISNIAIAVNDGNFILPKKYGFLEMFDVGNVNQLNIINRWKNNNIINSLETPVGIDEQGELFKLDLHEKAHGPHGLIAGMTGSGKSEWIITYILSMAVNYSPEEVQFVLIDYKGGGLALTFDNKETGVKLPHVVGTLTNLDVAEINRSLASINSELNKRQSMFKEAREKLNESSMDIYKYQQLYREGKLSEPMSHLFIISDEFAELKSQQPDFMDELISTARIGRSLGVHLILATQKPSGVVDDQIWSNSKFRICLKVQDKSDSNDMLKRPEAAMLKDTGRFYLQVGFNEFFALGQSAYAGLPYYESDKKVTLVDSAIDFVDEIGTVFKKGDLDKQNIHFVYKGEELPNILNYIIETAKTQNLNIKPLWLGSIPSVIYVDKLKSKYKYQKENFVLEPVVGEYDEPHNQNQNLLTVPITKDGNCLLYGATGSGKELFLTTLIYSLITTYTPQEVGIYILDFGTGVLKNFAESSHVGDIITSDDTEKIENLFKYIKREVNVRRRMFLDYNGNYQDFVAKSDKKIPNIVVIINSYEVFAELYNNLTDIVYELARECSKFGIYFVLSTNSYGGVKTKLLQTFKTKFALQLNSEFEYMSIFGNTDRLLPSKFFGRGLFKNNTVLEFQTAYAFEKEELYSKIKELSRRVFEGYKTKMRTIPVLPKEISFVLLNRRAIGLDYIPVGMLKKDLSIANISLDNKLSYILSFRNFDENIPFIDNFLNILERGNLETIVFDSKNIYDESKFQNIQYVSYNYSEKLNYLDDFINKSYEVYQQNNNNIRSIKQVSDIVCVIVGVNKFLGALTDEDMKKFINIVTKSKDILKVHFIFIDTPAGFKPHEFESWYKPTIDTSSGLWKGNGFAEQFLIKPTKVAQKYFEVIDPNYGYIVTEGQVEFVKLIDKM